MQKFSIMDTDSNKQDEEKEPSNGDPDPGDLLQPSRVRRTLCSCNEVDRIILDYGRDLLLPISIFLWIIFLAFG